MGYKGVLTSNLEVDGTKVGLGDATPEKLEFSARLLGGESLTKDECTITIKFTDDRQAEVATISADKYELPYTDTTKPAGQEESIAHVEYQLSGDSEWTPLKTTHVFRRRDGINMEGVKEVKFQVEKRAVADTPVKVEVYIGVSSKKVAAK